MVLGVKPRSRNNDHLWSDDHSHSHIVGENQNCPPQNCPPKGISRAGKSDIHLFFVFSMFFCLCLCSQIEAPLFPVSPILFLIAFLIHRGLRNKRSKCLSRGHLCFSVRIRKSYLMSFFWSGTFFPSFFYLPPLYFCQMYECLNPWLLLSHSKLELIVFFCDTQLLTINFNWSTFCAWVWLEALTKRRKAPHIAWYQTRVF